MNQLNVLNVLKEKKMTVLVGRSGSGKTIALKELACNLMDSNVSFAFVHARHSGHLKAIIGSGLNYLLVDEANFVNDSELSELLCALEIFPGNVIVATQSHPKCHGSGWFVQPFPSLPSK